LKNIKYDKSKKSDKKQREKAFASFYGAMRRLMNVLLQLENLEESNLSTDEVNQITSRVDKLASTLDRIKETHIAYANENKKKRGYFEDEEDEYDF
jgi:hypothetical protein